MEAAVSATAESAESHQRGRADEPTDTEDRPAKEPKELNFWLPVHVAAREHREALAEVAGLVADGLELDEAAQLVGIDADSDELPALHPYIPSPATIAMGCLDAQTTWSKNERRKRCMRPAMRWALVEASAAPISSERRAYDGLLR